MGAFVENYKKKENFSIGRNYYTVDYNKYHLSVREIFFYIVEYALLIIIFGYTFYRSFFAIIIFSPGILLLIKKKKNQLCLKRKQQLQVEFKEGISAVAKGLLSGLSTENAFIEAVQEMQILYGKNGLITKEFMYIKLQLSFDGKKAVLVQMKQDEGGDE